MACRISSLQHCACRLPFLTSVTLVGVAVGVAISSIYPLWSAIGAVIFLGERLSRNEWMGLAVTVNGVVVLALHTRNRQQCLKASDRHKRPLAGAMLAVAVSLLWAMSTFAIHQGGMGFAPSSVNLVRMTLALVISQSRE